ncbi:MAG: hypothetical protein HY221_00665 [Candidatus Sungbacteria bacterium]|uniref:Uncharacterized protein n=1 Tax=Candidatus Sungiibacteriota bacterium TaxID=2750080 RepID=A0A932VS59_9BACT|nr:hypothetical protein [Candidatus Sungbacteria bacterium]
MNKKEEVFTGLKREMDSARRFLARIKTKEDIALRTFLLMGSRLQALHKKIQPAIKSGEIPELAALEKEIDEALRTIARAKIRHEWDRKKKKSVRTFGDSSLHKKRVYKTLQFASR